MHACMYVCKHADFQSGVQGLGLGFLGCGIQGLSMGVLRLWVEGLLLANGRKRKGQELALCHSAGRTWNCKYPYDVETSQ